LARFVRQAESKDLRLLFAALKGHGLTGLGKKLGFVKGHGFSRAANGPKMTRALAPGAMQPILAVILSERSESKDLRLQFVALKGHGFKACPEPAEGRRPHPTVL
jgi:hypothetical protein